MITRMTSVLVLLLSTFSNLPAQQEFAGRWEGAITIGGMNLQIIVAFTPDGNALTGKIDIPQQGAAGIPLTNITIAVPKIHFELPAGPGLAIFDGEMQEGNIAGSFRQGAARGTFSLKPAPGTPVQEEPVPYREKEVAFHNGDIKLAGTLTVPDGSGPFPAIVMITGSGPQNRDEEILGFKVFRIIADHLTRHGVAVLRYDDRGVGGSTGKLGDATTEDFAGDVLQAVNFLKGRPEINPRSIGLCGHSEGGVIAPMVAARSNDIAFIILISGSAATGEEILAAQLRLILKAEGVPDTTIEKQSVLQKKLLKAILLNASTDEIRNDVRDLAKEQYSALPEAQQKVLGPIDEYLEKTAAAQVASLQSRWMKYFLSLDPARALGMVHCPVLAFFGGLDLQVPTGLNRPKLEAALRDAGNNDVTVKEFPNANHLYQSAVSGSPAEYASLKKEFVPGFLVTMTEWVLKRIR